MSLAKLSIDRSVLAWMLMAALVIFGSISFHRLGISQLPDVDFPVISVSLTLPGASPEVLETQVLDPIEDVMMQVDGIRNITSTAQQNSGSISLEFEMGKNIDLALQEVRNRIQQVQSLLPRALYPPALRKINPEDMPILWLGLTIVDPQTSLFELMMYAKDFVQSQLGVVSGVGNIVLGGYVDPALRVWLHLDRMNRFDLTSDDVLRAIQNEQLELPTGKLENSQNHYVRVLSEAFTPATFGAIRVQKRVSQGSIDRPMALRDVADIEEATVDVRRLTRMNKQPAVGIGIIKQHGANAVAVSDAVKKKLEELQPQISKKFHLGLRTDTTVFIKQSVRQLLFTLGVSALLTSIVCYIFLGSWSSTLNVLLSIPTSIIGTFTAFYFLNFTLNTFTLLGLSLAIGIVVDDSIMMLENIVRHREMKKSQRNAAIDGSEEITFAAIAATIAIAAIFIPVIFMKGVIGKYFFQYGITIAIAVFLSLLEALTLTPMRCSRYLIIKKEGKSSWMDVFFLKLSRGYEKFLKYLLKHRFKTLGVSLLFFVLSFGIAKIIPFEMMPAQDQSMYMLRFKFPVGTSLWVTSEKMKEVEEDLLKMAETKNVISAVGGFGGDAVNQGQIYVTLIDRDQRKRSQSEIIQAVRKKWGKKDPHMEMMIQDLSLRGFAATRGFPVEIVIQGPHWETLQDLSQKIMQGMKDSRRVVDVNTDIQNGMPEVQIVPNRAKLAAHGVSVATVTEVIETLMGGTLLRGQAEYPKQGHRYAIELRLVGSQRSDVKDLSRVMLRNNRGERIALNRLVDFKRIPSLLVISRLNRARSITIYGNPGQGYSQQQALQYTESFATSLLPPGYTLKMVGSSEAFRESFRSLWVALLLGIVVSYMVLASQFNSFIHPIAVLMALPFSFSGAFIALALCHQSVNMYSLIGFILLMGIVKKNSILLVDFTNQCRKSIQDVNEALVRACPVRLRPILMTSFATVAGALPEALSFGPGSEAMVPMAVALVGGVIASTVLTLFVVPCIYSLFSVFESES